MICKICGKEFEAKKHSARYCSEQCRWVGVKERQERAYEKIKAKKQPREKECAYCGKKFMQTGKEKMCSEDCREKARKVVYYKKKLPKEKTCPICGENFIGNPKKVFCSKKCVSRATVIKEHVDYPETKCAICGKVFKPKTNRSKCCSKGCTKKFHKEKSPTIEWTDFLEPYMGRPSKIDEKERMARQSGKHYEDLQRSETIDLYARVELPRWAIPDKV